MSEALKPCPFCGGEAVPMSRRNNGASFAQNDVDFWIYCQSEDCLAHVGMCETEEQAARIWNARVDASERHADGEYIGQLQARVEELEAALPQWRDIASAPKDGTHVVIGKWNEYGFGWNFDTAVSWWTEDWGWGGQEPEYPTHWMPLPTPPEQQ